MLIFISASMVIILINILFGYWRANVKKFSLQWFLAIHLPVPCVAYLRHQFHFEVGLTLLCFFAAYFLGQHLGSRLSNRLRRYGRVSSSLVHDLNQRSWIILIRR